MLSVKYIHIEYDTFHKWINLNNCALSVFWAKSTVQIDERTSTYVNINTTLPKCVLVMRIMYESPNSLTKVHFSILGGPFVEQNLPCHFLIFDSNADLDMTFLRCKAVFFKNFKCKNFWKFSESVHCKSNKLLGHTENQVAMWCFPGDSDWLPSRKRFFWPQISPTNGANVLFFKVDSIYT